MASSRVRFAAVVLFLLIAAAGCDWVQPGFDAGLSRNNPVEPSLNATTVPTLRQQFSVELAGVESGDPIVADGRLVAASTDQAETTATLEAFDASKGKRMWSTTLLSNGTNVQATAPVYGSGTIYVGVTTGGQLVAQLYAVSASSGAIEWSVTLPPSLLTTITVDNGKVLVPVFLPATFLPPPQVGTSELVAIDGVTGATLWTWIGPADSSPVLHVVVAPGGLIAVDYGQTAIVNEADGSTRQTLQNTTVVASANGLFYGQQPGTTVAIDPASGSTVWSIPTIGDSTPYAISKQSLMAADRSNDTISAYNPITGALEWSRPGPTGLYSNGVAAIANAFYYFPADLYPNPQTLMIYDTATGAVVSSLTIPDGGWDPIVADGKVYIGWLAIVKNTAQSNITAYAPA